MIKEAVGSQLHPSIDPRNEAIFVLYCKGCLFIYVRLLCACNLQDLKVEEVAAMTKAQDMSAIMLTSCSALFGSRWKHSRTLRLEWLQIHDVSIL